MKSKSAFDHACIVFLLQENEMHCYISHSDSVCYTECVCEPGFSSSFTAENQKRFVMPSSQRNIQYYLKNCLYLTLLYGEKY